jgi:phenylacetate-CoA ligase
VNSNLKMQLYWRLPVRIQEAVVAYHAGRLEKINFGPGFEEWKRRIENWMTRTPLAAQAWERDRLHRIIRLAAHEVPFYRSNWKGLEWQEIRSWKDLSRLPLLDKQSLRQNEEQFLVKGIDRKSLWMERTSGTTGTALRIFRPLAMQPKWWAVYEVCRRMAGVGREVPHARIAGQPIVAGSTRRPPYWRFNRRWGNLYMSSYHISRQTAPAYIAAMRQYGVQWLEGYGSAFAALAECAMEAGLPPVPLKAAIASGDTLLPGMRNAIESYFQCKCYDHYGQSEGVAMAMECAHGRMHVIPSSGVLEIVRGDGSPCALGEVGEIAATSLLNDSMPLVRYRIGDYAAWAADEHCPCGIRTRVIERLEGRVDDYLVTADGRRIGRLSTAVKRSPAIHSAQIVQDKPGHAYLLVRPSAGYQRPHAEDVRADILERIGRFDVDIVEVEAIPKTPNGKTSLVVRIHDKPHLMAIYQPLLQNAMK